MELLTWMVLSYSRPGMRILDPFMGGASTGEAAVRNGRHFVGIEKDAAIFAVAVDRLKPLASDCLVDGRSMPLQTPAKAPKLARTLRAARTLRTAIPARQRGSKVRASDNSRPKRRAHDNSPSMRSKAAIAPVVPRDSASFVRDNPAKSSVI